MKTIVVKVVVVVVGGGVISCDERHAIVGLSFITTGLPELKRDTFQSY